MADFAQNDDDCVLHRALDTGVLTGVEEFATSESILVTQSNQFAGCTFYASILQRFLGE